MFWVPKKIRLTLEFAKISTVNIFFFFTFAQIWVRLNFQNWKMMVDYKVEHVKQ